MTQADTYFDLGTWRRTVTTDSKDAQLWFDRGLNWTYAYNHAEAVACFERAAANDPNCAMAHVGIAYAAGPFYNYPWVRFSPPEVARTLERCHRAVTVAASSSARLTAVERALVDAIGLKYQCAEPVELDELVRWQDEFVRAMRDVYLAFPDDLDVLALYAESAITRTPRQLWDVQTGEPKPGADTALVQAALEPALERMYVSGESHPGVLHVHIHLMEMSAVPHAALRTADLLRDLVPEGGHLQHMPGHIYTLCGDYAQTVELSQKAVAVDDKFDAYGGGQTFYTTSRCHDLHLYMYAAMFLGRYREAKYAADRMYAMATPELVAQSWPYMASVLDGLSAMRTHVLVRFGRWRELAEMPAPPDPTLFPVRAAMHAYGQGVAFAALGDISSAESAKTRFRVLVESLPAELVLLSNLAQDVLAVGSSMLEGELEYRKRNFEAAFAALRAAVYRDDHLNYTEPWAWMHPPRHALGALLLEQAHYEEAETVYREDLGYIRSIPRCMQHPDNVWSLHGLLECVRRRGAHDEAGLLEQRLELALARADVDITSSCFCRGL